MAVSTGTRHYPQAVPRLDCLLARACQGCPNLTRRAGVLLPQRAQHLVTCACQGGCTAGRGPGKCLQIFCCALDYMQLGDTRDTKLLYSERIPWPTCGLMPSANVQSGSAMSRETTKPMSRGTATSTAATVDGNSALFRPGARPETSTDGAARLPLALCANTEGPPGGLLMLFLGEAAAGAGLQRDKKQGTYKRPDSSIPHAKPAMAMLGSNPQQAMRSSKARQWPTALVPTN